MIKKKTFHGLLKKLYFNFAAGQIFDKIYV